MTRMGTVHLADLKCCIIWKLCESVCKHICLGSYKNLYEATDVVIGICRKIWTGRWAEPGCGVTRKRAPWMRAMVLRSIEI